MQEMALRVHQNMVLPREALFSAARRHQQQQQQKTGSQFLADDSEVIFTPLTAPRHGLRPRRGPAQDHQVGRKGPRGRGWAGGAVVRPIPYIRSGCLFCWTAHFVPWQALTLRGAVLRFAHENSETSERNSSGILFGGTRANGKDYWN